MINILKIEKVLCLQRKILIRKRLCSIGFVGVFCVVGLSYKYMYTSARKYHASSPYSENLYAFIQGRLQIRVFIREMFCVFSTIHFNIQFLLFLFFCFAFNLFCRKERICLFDIDFNTWVTRIIGLILMKVKQSIFFKLIVVIFFIICFS